MSKFPQTPKRPLAAIRRFVRDRRGAAAVMLAIALSGIIGFAGLGSEVAAWYFTTRAMQGAADAAAESAAAELAAGTVSGSSVSSDQLTHTGRAVSATFNFSNGVSSTTVTVNHPPLTTTGLFGELRLAAERLQLLRRGHHPAAADAAAVVIVHVDGSDDHDARGRLGQHGRGQHRLRRRA